MLMAEHAWASTLATGGHAKKGARCNRGEDKSCEHDYDLARRRVLPHLPEFDALESLTVDHLGSSLFLFNSCLVCWLGKAGKREEMRTLNIIGIMGVQKQYL